MSQRPKAIVLFNHIRLALSIIPEMSTTTGTVLELTVIKNSRNIIIWKCITKRRVLTQYLIVCLLNKLTLHKKLISRFYRSSERELVRFERQMNVRTSAINGVSKLHESIDNRLILTPTAPSPTTTILIEISILMQ